MIMRWVYIPEFKAKTKTQQVEEHLRDAFRRAVPGEHVMPERELAKHLGVNRATIRDALKGLEIEGLVRRKQGGGTTIPYPEDS